MDDVTPVEGRQLLHHVAQDPERAESGESRTVHAPLIAVDEKMAFRIGSSSRTGCRSDSAPILCIPLLGAQGWDHQSRHTARLFSTTISSWRARKRPPHIAALIE